MPSGHFLGDLGLTGDLTGGLGGDLGLTCSFFFINIHLPVLGFNTLPSGHFLGELGLTGTTLLVIVFVSIEVSGLASLRTYINILDPLLKLKQRSLTFNFLFNNSGIHFIVFKQKSLCLIIFQSYFISSHGIFLVIFLSAIAGSMLLLVQPL